MTNLKKTSGILLTALFAVVIRLLAEYEVLELNSYSFLVITPFVLGFIPFFIKNSGIEENLGQAILFPLIADAIFLLIAIGARLEDFICIIIIGWPYILGSVFMSILIQRILKYRNQRIHKNTLSILFLPLILGVIEKQIPKHEQVLEIQNEIIINTDNQTVWDNLLVVPDLSQKKSKGLFYYLGVPSPIKSSYDERQNIRLGHFENGIVLNESVIHRSEGKELTFHINVQASNISNSPTLQHILESKSLEFDKISYQLTEIGENKTKLKLITKFKLNSNLPFYANFWADLLINDFEQQLLNSLKSVLEDQKEQYSKI